MVIGRGLVVGLFLGILVLCAAIASELTAHFEYQQAALPERTSAPPGNEPTSGVQSPNQRGSWFKDIAARPLFSPDRRPVRSDASSVHGLPRLTGIVVTESQRIAIFAAPSDGHSVVVEAGSRLGAYDVRSIADAGVTVVGPEGTTVIRPIFDLSPKALPLSARSPAFKPPPVARPELPKAQAN